MACLELVCPSCKYTNITNTKEAYCPDCGSNLLCFFDEEGDHDYDEDFERCEKEHDKYFSEDYDEDYEGENY